MLKKPLFRCTLLLALALALTNIPTAQAANPAIVGAGDVVDTNPNWNEVDISGVDILNYTPNTSGAQKLTITNGTLSAHFAAGASENNSSKIF